MPGIEELEATARALVARGKGILAADESTGTITRRFDAVGLESKAETRQAYRQMLFTTPGIEEYLSGVILFDETIHQSTVDGTPFAELLASRGIIPGIKVDTGAKPLAGFPGETVTEGLDGLRERLAGYVALGARFTKWRAVITIGDGIPSRFCLVANAHALARFAALSQEAGLVPIIEPEVLMDGDHTVERCQQVSERTLRTVFGSIVAHRVALEGLLLKTNMVLSGKDCPEQAGPEEVAGRTIACFRRTVPAAVPGIVFLSGGQDDLDSTVHLDAISRAGRDLPWDVSFSYGRGLQALPLLTWKGERTNVPAGQDALLRRSRVTAAARDGRYTRDME